MERVRTKTSNKTNQTRKNRTWDFTKHGRSMSDCFSFICVPPHSAKLLHSLCTHALCWREEMPLADSATWSEVKSSLRTQRGRVECLLNSSGHWFFWENSKKAATGGSSKQLALCWWMSIANGSWDLWHVWLRRRHIEPPETQRVAWLWKRAAMCCNVSMRCMLVWETAGACTMYTNCHNWTGQMEIWNV